MELLISLSKDYRRKLEALGKTLSLSPGAVSYRIKKLEEKKIIKWYTIDVDYEALDLDSIFFIIVWAPPDEVENVAEILSRMKRVVEVHMIDVDEILVKAVLSDRTELLSLLERINRIEKIIRTSAIPFMKVFNEKGSLGDLLG